MYVCDVILWRVRTMFITLGYSNILVPGIREKQFNGALTLRLLMSYIYGAPSKARNANVVYIWTYVWQR